jgi:hypothetical protein
MTRIWSEYEGIDPKVQAAASGRTGYLLPELALLQPDVTVRATGFRWRSRFIAVTMIGPRSVPSRSTK